MISIALADDHKLFREGIRYLLENMDSVTMIFEAANGKELLEMVKEEQPDIILLDLEMPEMDGITALKILKADYPRIGVIILTMYNDDKMISHLMEQGANGYLLKNTNQEELELAIKSVSEKGFYFNDYMAKAMLTGLKSQNQKKPALKNSVELTSREMEVLELICQELTTKEIADKLFISHRTAEGHRKNLIDKFGVKNTAGLIIKAIKEGIITI